jgi:hypothetical protein
MFIDVIDEPTEEMEPTSGIVVLFVLSMVGVAARVRQAGVPERRTYLFETADGDRANPFADFAAGADETSPTCRNCRQALSSEQFRYCLTCLPA